MLLPPAPGFFFCCAIFPRSLTPRGTLCEKRAVHRVHPPFEIDGCKSLRHDNNQQNRFHVSSPLDVATFLQPVHGHNLPGHAAYCTGKGVPGNGPQHCRDSAVRCQQFVPNHQDAADVHGARKQRCGGVVAQAEGILGSAVQAVQKIPAKRE
jgi:hypothetical protein